MSRLGLVGMLLTAYLAAGPAEAGSIRDWPCPETMEGKWYPYSRRTIDTIGLLEVRPGSIWLSLHGHIGLTEVSKVNDTLYWKLDRSFAFKNRSPKYYKHFMAYHLPHEMEPIGPEEKCLMQVVFCDTEKEMVEYLSGGGNHYCSWSTYIPLAHAVEFMGVNEYELRFEDMHKAPD